MNWRNTLILAIIALAGVAYFRFFEMKRPSTVEAARQAQDVVNFDRDKIDGIIIKNGDQQIEIRRRETRGGDRRRRNEQPGYRAAATSKGRRRGRGKWSHLDSNQGPPACEAGALTS